MKRITALALILVATGFCFSADAADEASTATEERKSTIDITYDAAVLTARVLEAFPDGLPFDRACTPTDEEKATQFWQLIADMQMTFKGQQITPGTAVHVVCGVAGLPLFFTPTAMEKFKAAEGEKEDIENSESVKDILIASGRLVGVERAVVAPIGIILATPDDPEKITNVVTIPPSPLFLWRADIGALVKEAFPNGYDVQNASDEDKKKLVELTKSLRCDLVVPGEGKLSEFVRWIAQKSSLPFSIEEGVYRQMLEPDKTVGPVAARFTPFVDALNAALEPAGFVLTAETTHYEITVAPPVEDAKEDIGVGMDL
jgi:hypothetical protein